MAGIKPPVRIPLDSNRLVGHNGVSLTDGK
jgi:hypothetical protein